MWLVALGALMGAAGAAPARRVVPLRDLKPSFVQGGKLLRSHDGRTTGLLVNGKRRRGLNTPAPARVGFDLDGAFERLVVTVAVPDGAKRSMRFRVVGDGRPLAATPPLFAGGKPVELDVPLTNVLLLELVVTDDIGGRGYWLGGELHAREGRDLGPFRALAESFDEKDYPHAFKQRVNTAIRRGVAYLRGRQDADGLWPIWNYKSGGTALVLLALLKAGVPVDDEAVRRGFAAVRARPYRRVYSVSVLLLALEARYFPGTADAEAILDRPRLAKKKIPDEDYQWIRDAAQWLADQQGKGFPEDQRKANPVWRYPAGGYDLSNTQYALLGLLAARRCGVPSGKVWLPALKHLLEAQEKDGPEVRVSRYFRSGKGLRRQTERARARGFGYNARAQPTGAMTSAGLCALVFCQQALHRSQRFQQGYKGKTRRAIRDALAWLEEYYAIDENPLRADRWWTYYLFNLERTGVLLDQRYIGTRDWYQEGAEALLKTQRKDGRMGDGVLDTAFALLFLKRATVAATTNPLK